MRKNFSTITVVILVLSLLVGCDGSSSSVLSLSNSSQPSLSPSVSQKTVSFPQYSYPTEYTHFAPSTLFQVVDPFTQSIRKTQAKLSLQTTGNTFTVSDNKITFSYENGKVKNNLPSVWVPKVYNCINGEGFTDYAFFVSSYKTAVACIDKQQLAIIVSDNMGKSWHQSDVNLTFKDFDNSEYGFTTNSLTIGSIYYVYLEFITADCGYAVLGLGITMGSNAKFVLKTTDGGKTWDYVSFMERNEPQTGFHFINENVGFIAETSPNVAEGNIAMTTDGGVTWSNFRIDHKVNFPYDDWQSYIFAPYFSKGKGYLPILLQNRNTNATKMIGYVSADNGKTWTYDPSYSS